ncbi:MAG: peptidylprolyl isomerase [Planctomycetaceae bacterium]|nr:peptidylprolyl isomerase [Planctomycetaceae bacterium]
MRALLLAALLLPAQDPQAPAEFKVKLETSRGDLLIKVVRDWAPKGADRFHALVKAGYYDECRFYRVLPKSIAQFGIHGTPATASKWKEQPIDDDPVKQKNLRGRLTFAKGGPNSRTTNLFLNLRDHADFDSQGFAPIGEVVDGMEVADQLFVTGEGAPRGRGPSQKRIYEEGNKWLEKDFKDLDYVKKATVIE